MPKFKNTLILYALILFLSIINAEEPELHQLNVLFRHGDRTPETFPKRFPNDPNMNNTFYPMGSGGLTNEGKRRMYRFGQFLRNQYSTFLGNEYVNDRLFNINSGLSRTKMSLQLVLAALYPPSLSSNRWNDDLDWQPIPTYYYEFKQDRYFNQDKCERYVDELARISNSTEVKCKLKKFEELFDYLKLAVGKKSRLTLNDILILHNNLNIEKQLNLKLEPWMIDVLADDRLAKARSLYYEIHSFNDLMKRLQAGPLLRRISEDMFKARNKTLGYEQKISLYSAHDKNIITMLQALKLYDSHFPEFSSALIFELLSQNEKYYVKILYYLGIPEKTKNLTIPGCPTLCPLDQFLMLTENARIFDKELDCKINDDTYFPDDD